MCMHCKNNLRCCMKPNPTLSLMTSCALLIPWRASIVRWASVQIAELAYALELWLEERIDKPHVVNEQHIALIDQVVQRLDELCAIVREQRQEPLPQPELIAQLQASKEIAVSEAAPLALEELPATDIELTAAPVENIAEPELIPEIGLDFVPASGKCNGSIRRVCVGI